MRYLIMCGGASADDEYPRQLYKINGESLIARTVRLLRENGIEPEITSHNKVFKRYAPLIEYNSINRPYYWVDAFYLTGEPTTYLFGDVLYSPAAIKKIIETKTDTIQFFASAPPFAPCYPKEYAEPLAFKVVATERFEKAIKRTKWLADNGCFSRSPISWELWQVIKGTSLNNIVTNYIVINDYSCDIDSEEEYDRLRHHPVLRMPFPEKETEP